MWGKSCTFVPDKYADAYANDQDWALMYYLMVTAQVP